VNDRTTQRYGTVAMTLHWLIAAAIIGMLVVGKYMHGLPDSDANKFALYQLHKSFGITILALTLVRVGWRLMHPAPPLPATMAWWERRAAHASHFLLYALMLGLPLTGWLRVSTDTLQIPTLWFGLFEVPALPFGASDRLSHLAHDTHELLGNTMILLLLAHVAAALKHHFWDRDNVLKRMLPFTRVE
jgi:cytochrome b561